MLSTSIRIYESHVSENYTYARYKREPAPMLLIYSDQPFLVTLIGTFYYDIIFILSINDYR